jgi:hypothetical protein
LQRYGNEMTPETFGRAKKALEIGTSDAKEQGLAESFWNSSNNNIAGALKMAREKLSGREEDQVVQRLKIFESERTSIIQAGQNDAKDKAWRSYSETGNFSKIPPSILASMDGADLASLQRTAKADLEARTKGTEVKTNSNVYYQLTQEAMYNPDFADSRKFDLRQYFDRLSPGDRNHFINLQRTIGQPVISPTAKLVGSTRPLTTPETSSSHTYPRRLFCNAVSTCRTKSRINSGRKKLGNFAEAHVSLTIFKIVPCPLTSESASRPFTAASMSRSKSFVATSTVNLEFAPIGTSNCLSFFWPLSK